MEETVAIRLPKDKNSIAFQQVFVEKEKAHGTAVGFLGLGVYLSF